MTGNNNSRRVPRAFFPAAAGSRLLLLACPSKQLALSKSKYNNERVGIGERSLGRLNDVSFYGDGVRTEAQRWQVILLSRSGKSYTV